MNLLVSACLLGLPCRYDGRSVSCPGALALLDEFILIPVCPEIYGGLPTPRPPAQRQGERVVTQAGEDVTRAYRQGAECALALARLNHCRAALLKAKSPSCGRGRIYNGRFDGGLIPGDGVTAALLEAAGIPVFSEDGLEALRTYLAGLKGDSEFHE